MNDAEIRADILDTAKGYVLKDRNSTYGTPEDNFKRIAILWEAYDQIRRPGPETPIDVSIKMILMKIARLAHNPGHKDSWVDTAGYAACGAGIALVPPPKKGIEAFQVPKSEADMQREYVGKLSAREPKPSPTDHQPGLYEKPDCMQGLPNLLSAIAVEQDPVDNDYMYQSICGYLESRHNHIMWMSIASFQVYCDMHCKRMGLTKDTSIALRHNVDHICKRQGHTLYLC